MVYRPRPPIRAAQRSALNHLRSVVAPQTAPQATPQAQAQPQAQFPDWQADPVLQRIVAQQQASVAQAQAAAVSARQQAEINYGYDPGYQYADQNTSQAAQQNPFSVLAQLSQQHQRNETGIDEGYNKQNLFYSGHRAQALGDESQGYLQRQYQAGQALHGQLSGITQNLLAAQTGASNAVGQGESDAYTRGLNFQLQYGGYPAAAVTPAHQAVPRPRAASLLAQQRPRMRYA
jgi:hypothetical protein